MEPEHRKTPPYPKGVAAIWCFIHSTLESTNRNIFVITLKANLPAKKPFNQIGF
jgi:hypothetical protein